MIYTIVTKEDYGDSISLQLATAEFPNITKWVETYAERNVGYNKTIVITAWFLGKEQNEYEYYCETQSVYKSSGCDNIDLEQFLDTLSERLERRAELNEAKSNVDSLARQLAQAQRKLAELEAK